MQIKKRLSVNKVAALKHSVVPLTGAMATTLLTRGPGNKEKS
jgi:hypothetical protein